MKKRKGGREKKGREEGREEGMKKKEGRLFYSSLILLKFHHETENPEEFLTK